MFRLEMEEPTSRQEIQVNLTATGYCNCLALPATLLVECGFLATRHFWQEGITKITIGKCVRTHTSQADTAQNEQSQSL